MSSAPQLTPSEEAQLTQTIEMFEVITQSQPHDYQSLEILREAYFKLNREQELIETSKRIAQAYVQMGQLSSAILEYESILQRCPEDEQTRQALAEIESKATSLNHQGGQEDLPSRAPSARARAAGHRPPASEFDDGRRSMHKLFVEGKLVNERDFEECWVDQDWTTAPTKPVESFVQRLAERELVPLEKSLRLISDKVRLAYLPIEKYDIDIEVARGFPAETCRRWCVLPFDRMSKSILVATVNPYNRQAASELEAVSGHRLLWYLAPPQEIILNLKKVFR